MIINHPIYLMQPSFFSRQLAESLIGSIYIEHLDRSLMSASTLKELAASNDHSKQAVFIDMAVISTATLVDQFHIDCRRVQLLTIDTSPLVPLEVVA